MGRNEAPVKASKSIDAQLQAALAWLKKHSTKATLDGMVKDAAKPLPHLTRHVGRGLLDLAQNRTADLRSNLTHR